MQRFLAGRALSATRASPLSVRLLFAGAGRASGVARGLGLFAALAVLNSATVATQFGPRSLPTIIVTNGEAAVAEAVVTLALPGALVGESFIVRDQDGDQAVATQLLRNRTLAFVVRGMAPREVRRLRLEPALDRPVTGPIVARPEGDGVALSIDGAALATYRTQPSLPLAGEVPAGLGRGAYLHPLHSPSGRVVTGDDAPGRVERRGVWSAWGASRFDGRTPDFWHIGSGRGAVEFEGVAETWSGPILAGFRAGHRAVDRTVRPPVTAAIETWRVTAPALGKVGPPHRVLDLEIRHETAGRHALVVATGAVGGLGVQAPIAWGGATGMAVVAAEGRARSTASRTRARWVALVGRIGGANAGLAVLDHPANLRHPQPLYVDPVRPFAAYAPVQLGAISIVPGQDLVLRYRLVTFDGWPDRAWLERLWQAYAHPPTAAFADLGR